MGKRVSDEALYDYVKWDAVTSSMAAELLELRVVARAASAFERKAWDDVSNALSSEEYGLMCRRLGKWEAGND